MNELEMLMEKVEILSAGKVREADSSADTDLPTLAEVLTEIDSILASSSEFLGSRYNTYLSAITPRLEKLRNGNYYENAHRRGYAKIPTIGLKIKNKLLALSRTGSQQAVNPRRTSEHLHQYGEQVKEESEQDIESMYDWDKSYDELCQEWLRDIHGLGYRDKERSWNKRLDIYNTKMREKYYREPPEYETPETFAAGRIPQVVNKEKIPAYAEDCDSMIPVAGDGMEPVFHDGETIYLKYCDTLLSYDPGVFIVDGKLYLRVYTESDPAPDEIEQFTDADGNVHKKIVLTTYKNRREPIVITPDTDFHIMGKALRPQ